MPNPFLQEGDEGPPVSALQLALATLGFDVGSVDGVFRDTTTNAVKQFQGSQGFRASGTVDDATWELLGGQPIAALTTRIRLMCGGPSRHNGNWQLRFDCP